MAETGTGTTNRLADLGNGRILAKHLAFDRAVEILQFASIRLGQFACRDTSHSGDHGLDIGNADRRPLAGIDPQAGSGLVNHIDGLIRQATEVNVSCRKIGGRFKGSRRIFHSVVFFVGIFEALQNLNGFFDSRLQHVDLLETPRQSPIFLKEVLVFFVSGGTDAA